MDERSAGEPTPTPTPTRSDSHRLEYLQESNFRESNAALVQQVNSNVSKNVAGNKSDKNNALEEPRAIPTLVTTVSSI